jgi:hypothetical protein
MAHAARHRHRGCARGRGQLILDLEQLVDLFLVLDDGEADRAASVQDEEPFPRRPHPGTSAPARRPGICAAHIDHVQARAVVPDDGQVVAALETECEARPQAMRADLARRHRTRSRSARCPDISRASPDDRRARRRDSAADGETYRAGPSLAPIGCSHAFSLLQQIAMRTRCSRDLSAATFESKRFR